VESRAAHGQQHVDASRQQLLKSADNKRKTGARITHDTHKLLEPYARPHVVVAGMAVLRLLLFDVRAVHE
jgi:hypothetical protein